MPKRYRYLLAPLILLLLLFAIPSTALAAGGGGANQSCGAYCPTASQPGDHGNQPADGTKGKADSKNPPGQAPSGSDANAGYECDSNQGVGQGNPAHTACSTTSTSSTPTTSLSGPPTTAQERRHEDSTTTTTKRGPEAPSESQEALGTPASVSAAGAAAPAPAPAPPVLMGPPTLALTPTPAAARLAYTGMTVTTLLLTIAAILVTFGLAGAWFGRKPLLHSRRH